LIRLRSQVLKRRVRVSTMGGVELSAIHYHVVLAMVVALMCGLCALVVVETIADEVG